MPKTLYLEKPEWEPLEKVVGERCRDFVFMGMAPVGEIWICLYKHVVSRRYLNLDGRGGAYRFEDGKYHPISLEQALKHVDGLAFEMQKMEASVQRFQRAISHLKIVLGD